VVAMAWLGVNEQKTSIVAGLLRKTTARDGAPPGAVAGGSSSDIVGNLEEEMTQLWTGLDDGEKLERW
jgi:hypothetical protein